MSDEERTGATPGETAGEPTPEQAGAEHVETAAGGEDPRDERIRLMEEENARLRAQAEEREGRSSEGRAEALPTTHAPSYEQLLAAEARQIEAERIAIMEQEAREGQTVESIRRAQKLIQREGKLTAAVTSLALKKTELNTFVAGLPKEDRDSFRAFAASDGHRYADLEALYDGYEAKKLRAERGRVKETAARADAIIKRNGEGRVATTTREVTAAEAKEKRQKMTGKQFDAKYNDLIDRGDHAGALALSQSLNSGQIEVED